MIRIIGDIHGHTKDYLKLVENYPRSIQLGDFGFARDWYWLGDSDLSSDNHKVIAGNHDDYSVLTEIDHSLGDYGTSPWTDFSFFYIRGANSIDKEYRVPGYSWWEAEELSYQTLAAVITLYEETKPDIVLSHTGPSKISSGMFKPIIKYSCRTEDALQQMYNIHQPKLWIFGHWHITSRMVDENTTFICLGELNHIDVNSQLSLSENIENIGVQLHQRSAKNKRNT